MINRRRATAHLLGACALPQVVQEARAAGTPEAVLRVPFLAAETGFDPAQIGDLYSHYVTGHIFEAPYRYDLLAIPVQVRTLTAAALPEVSADFRVWTVRLTPGIFFADDPAFKGRPRELAAQDYVYAIKRYFDPANKSPGLSLVEEEGFVGMDAVRAAALRGKLPFDYDAPVEGLKAIDRYTLRIAFEQPRPRFIYKLCDAGSFGAVAREVVEAYGADIMGHPVGTGPYRLKSWRRSSRIVLERNPGFREMLYDGEPAAGDAQGQAWLARFKGRRLPLNDGVEISVLEEGQARWLAFLSGQVDYTRVPPEFTHLAIPNGKLAPNLARRDIGVRTYVNPDYTMSFFNMDDPVVGGYARSEELV